MSSDTNGASQPFFFQLMKCEASELLITSAAWMLLEYSWATRWNSRSAPERSICTVDARIFRLERLAELFADGKVHRRIQDHLAFLSLRPRPDRA